MVLLFVVTSPVSAHTACNSKRPAAQAPTLLNASSTKVTTSKSVTKMAKKTVALAARQAAKAAAKMKTLAKAGGKAIGNRLARLTAYWSGEGDYYTRHHISSTGIHLHKGHCAVDPHIIPYGSIVTIEGLGSYLAVDTGTAVVSRQAARESGHTRVERSALVIDLYFENRREGERFAAKGPKFASITWSKPTITVNSDRAEDTATLASATDERSRSKGTYAF